MHDKGLLFAQQHCALIPRGDRDELKREEEQLPVRELSPCHAGPCDASSGHAPPRQRRAGLLEPGHGKLAELRTPVAKSLPHSGDLENLDHLAWIEQTRQELDLGNDMP